MANLVSAALNAFASQTPYPGDAEALHELIGDYFGSSDEYRDDWSSGM